MSALTPREYAIADTAQLCEAIGLPWNGAGYGLLFCVDESGRRWTLVTGDLDYWRLIKTADEAGVLGGSGLPAEKFPVKRPGWPDEWGTP